ncbi:MAG: PIG-L family deacetylase [Bdellovibrionales bacterium]|nr:PIG-L family deacetylase [Bdellovibrionales bacterium]
MADIILVVAAHPDDEALGCGGTMARHAAAGDEVHVVFMADGVGARQGGAAELAERNAHMDVALAALGAKSAHSLGFPDNQMDSVPFLRIVQALEAAFTAVAPTIVYTHHVSDLNVDHRLTAAAVLTACRPIPGNAVREILAFEIMSSTEWAGPDRRVFEPSVFVDITDTWPQKRAALEAYAREMRPPPHSRSVEHLDVLSRHRGMSVGIERAEAFVVLRQVRR